MTRLTLLSVDAELLLDLGQVGSTEAANDGFLTNLLQRLEHFSRSDATSGREGAVDVCEGTHNQPVSMFVLLAANDGRALLSSASNHVDDIGRVRSSRAAVACQHGGRD